MVEKELSNSVINLEGSTFNLGNDNLNFIENAKYNAKQHEYLFHCTSMDVLLSIIKNKEFWLTNLKYVNDIEEYNRINKSEYENSFYVACFTYENDIPKSHWIEYGTLDNGILFSVKRDWFDKSITLLTDLNQEMSEPRIYPSFNKAIESGDNPCYFNFEFDFYQIIYDNDLKKKIYGNGKLISGENELNMKSVVPSVAGIIKNKSGICERRESTPYEKDWSSEKEVRLKLGIMSPNDLMKGPSSPISTKIAVSLNDNAFEKFQIRFSPKISEEKKESFIKELYKLLPSSNIKILQ